MTDHEYLEDVSGEAGRLSQTMHAFKEINNTLTKAMDAWGSPDETDAFDADCNTCKHFVRGKFDKIAHPPHLYGFPGQCTKFDKPVTGWQRGLFTGNRCYENRRTGEKAWGVE